jgi:uncharacterized protein YceK
MKKKMFRTLALLALAVTVLAGCASMIVVSIDDESIAGPKQARQYVDINPKDITIYANYKDGSRKPLSLSKNDITFDSSKLGPQTVKVRTSKGDVTFDTEVMALTGITVSAQPKAWKLGVQVRVPKSSGGGVGSTYAQAAPGNDVNSWPGLEIQGVWDQMGSENLSASAIADECVFRGFTPLARGKQTVTVEWKGKSTTFNIEVVALESLRIANPPTKTTFYRGDSFDRTGLKVIGTWPILGEEDVTSKVSSSYDPQKTGAQTATVTYEGKTATFNIQILPSPSGTWSRRQNFGDQVMTSDYRFTNGNWSFSPDGWRSTTLKGTYKFDASTITMTTTEAWILADTSKPATGKLRTKAEALEVVKVPDSGWGADAVAAIDMVFGTSTYKWSATDTTLTLTIGEGMTPSVYTRK